MHHGVFVYVHYSTSFLFVLRRHVPSLPPNGSRSLPSYFPRLHLLHTLYYSLAFLPSCSSHPPSHDPLCSLMIYKRTYISTPIHKQKYIPIIFNVVPYLRENMQYCLYVWLISFSSDFQLHHFSWKCHSFLFLWLHKIPLCVCTTFCLFFGRHLGWLHFLAIVTSTAINTGVQWAVCWF